MPPRAKKSASPKMASSPKKTASPKSRPKPALSPSRRSAKASDGMRRCMTPGGHAMSRTFTMAEKKGNTYTPLKGRYVAELPSKGAQKTSRAAFSAEGLEKKDGASVTFYMMELRRDPQTGRLSRDHSLNPVFRCEVRQVLKEKGGVLAQKEKERAAAKGGKPNLSIAQRSVVSLEPISQR